MENRYEKYKDSGIAWIGNIPEHWEVKKLGHLYIPRNEKVSDQDYPALSVTMQGVLLQLENVAKTNDGDNRKLVKIGDFAINSRSDRRGSCGISKYDGSVSLINIVLTPINDMNPVYYEWLFHSSLFSDEYYRWEHGIVNDLWTTRWQEMKNIQIAAPPLHEQQLIATYLDKKCGEIDELITLQEEMITKLQSYKQSVITEAVTKGLDKNVPLKDSGIEWIGEIPEHWKVKRLKFSCNVFGRIGFRGYKSDDLVSEGNGAITLSPSNMKDMKMDYTNRTYLSWKKYYESPEIMISKNDILMVKTGSTYGKCSFVDDIPMECTINPQIVVFKQHKDYPKFLAYSFQTKATRAFVETSVVGGTIPTIAQEKIMNYFFAFPPLSEQQSIANYLDQKCSEIDELISIKQQKIEKLKDYKKSLIFECVTGKRKVS